MLFLIATGTDQNSLLDINTIGLYKFLMSVWLAEHSVNCYFVQFT